MTEERDRRAVPRATLDEGFSARVRGLRGVHLLDLSPTGAQIEHLGLLRLHAACDLDLPPPFGALTLPAQVVWCAVIGRRRTRGGETHLVAHTGLRFPTLTLAQHAALAAFLQSAQDARALDSPLASA